MRNGNIVIAAVVDIFIMNHLVQVNVIMSLWLMVVLGVMTIVSNCDNRKDMGYPGSNID